MRSSSIIVLLSACAAVSAAPIASPVASAASSASTGTNLGNTGIGGLTSAGTEAVAGGDNVQSVDDIADRLGVAQYGDPDNAEDENVLPQELADDLIGSKTKVRRQGIVTGALPSEAAKPLEQTNTAVDGILADGDQIANNVLGVCGENTSASDDDCTGLGNENE